MTLTTDPTQAPQFSTAEFEPELEDSPGHFGRGVLFGVGGALLGLALYSAVVIITDYEIGFVSLAVGFIVGKAVLMGSRGRAGRRYQIAAALLTYLAVSMSTVPIVIAQVIRLNGASQSASAQPGTKESTPGAAATPTESEPAGVGGAVMALLFVGLTAPFLGLQEMPGGLISLIILAVGVQIAWKMTGSRQLLIEQAITGPPDEDKPSSLNLSR